MSIIDKDKIITNTDSFYIKDYEVELNPKKGLSDLKVVFMGTPSFAVPILEMLINKTNVIMVVCQQSKKKDRKGNIIDPDTKVLADSHNIEVFQPEHIKTDYQYILDKQPDIIITCAYGQIIPEYLLDYPKYGCINVHGSLLPDLRGGAPIHWAIIKGYTETGITIMYMDKKMDSGDIISQEKLTINEDDTLDIVYEKMSHLGSSLLEKTLPSIINKTNNRLKQDESLVTYAYNISPEDEKIDFSKTGIEIKNLVRGLNSIPGAYCYLDDKRIKIYNIEILKANNNSEYGKIVDIDKESIICTCNDSLLKIKEIKLEGKKRCLVKDYLNGINKNQLIGKVLK